jgi:hypothetical protein
MWTMIITYYVSHASHERLLMDRQFPSTPGTYSPVSMKKIYTVGDNYVYCCTSDYFFTLRMHLAVDMTIKSCHLDAIDLLTNYQFVGGRLRTGGNK